MTTMRFLTIAAGVCLQSFSCATVARADDASPSSAEPPRPDEWQESARGMRVLLAVATGTGHFFDLSMYGLGGAISFGGEGRHWGGAFNAQYLQARTVAGLAVNDLQLSGTADVKVDDWFRFGFGGGIEWVFVHRITSSGNTLSGLGPMVELTVAHDFDSRPRPCFFLEADFKASLVGGGNNGDPAGVLSAALLAGLKIR
jgi:hypothetical protein